MLFKEWYDKHGIAPPAYATGVLNSPQFCILNFFSGAALIDDTACWSLIWYDLLSTHFKLVFYAQISKQQGGSPCRKPQPKCFKNGKFWHTRSRNIQRTRRVVAEILLLTIFIQDTHVTEVIFSGVLHIYVTWNSDFMHALFTSLNCNNNYLNMSPQIAHELYGTKQHNTINTIQYNRTRYNTIQWLMVFSKGS